MIGSSWSGGMSSPSGAEVPEAAGTERVLEGRMVEVTADVVVEVGMLVNQVVTPSVDIVSVVAVVVWGAVVVVVVRILSDTDVVLTMVRTFPWC